MRFKKICFIGYGSHVNKTIIPYLNLNKKNIKIVTTKLNINKYETFPNIDNALSKISKDYLIYNATPPKFHFSTSKLILSRGYNLIVEKPICLNAYQLNKLIHIAKKKKLIVFENMMYFYTEQFLFFKNFFKHNEKIINSFKINFTLPTFNKKSFRNSTDLEASLLYDVACYPFSLISYLGYRVTKFDIEYKYKNQILNYLKITFKSKKIKFHIIVAFFYKYKNFIKINLYNNQEIEINHFFYGKKIKKKILLQIMEIKKKKFFINETNVFKKILTFNKNEFLEKSEKQFKISIKYLKILNKLRRLIK